MREDSGKRFRSRACIFEMFLHRASDGIVKDVSSKPTLRRTCACIMYMMKAPSDVALAHASNDKYCLRQADDAHLNCQRSISGIEVETLQRRRENE